MRGNMGYFRVILALAQLGPLTSALAVLGLLVAPFGLRGAAYAGGILGGTVLGACGSSWIVFLCHESVLCFLEWKKKKMRSAPSESVPMSITVE